MAYWADGSGDGTSNDARVLAVLGSRLVSLDAKTGERDSDFGDDGEVEVDLIQGYDDRVVESFRCGRHHSSSTTSS